MKKYLINAGLVISASLLLFTMVACKNPYRKTLGDKINIDYCVILDSFQCKDFVSGFLKTDKKGLMERMRKAVWVSDFYKFAQLCTLELKDTLQNKVYKIDLIDSGLFRYNEHFYKLH